MYINFVSGFASATLFNLVSSVGFEMSYPNRNTIFGLVRILSVQHLTIKILFGIKDLYIAEHH